MEGAPGDPGYVRGSALGLPADGPGAVAPIWRRLLTLIVDWALSVGIAMLLFNYHELAVLGTFVVLNLLCISLFGATPGQSCCGCGCCRCGVAAPCPCAPWSAPS